MAGRNNSMAVDNEEWRPVLKTVLEQVRLQQEKMNSQDKVISKLQNEIRIQNKVISRLIEKVKKVERHSFNSSDNQFRVNLDVDPSDLDNHGVRKQDVYHQDVERQSIASRMMNRGSLLSSFVGSNGSNNQTLPRDVYSLMMLSGSSRGVSGALAGFICFLYQCILYTLVLIETADGNNIFQRAYPWRQKPVIYVGQAMIIGFLSLTQSDIFSSVRTFIWFWKDPRWDIVLLGKNEGDDPPSRWKWRLHIFIPNFLKFLQGNYVIFVCGIVIGESSTFLDLAKDFSALMIIRELDNMLFAAAAYGYLGKTLYEMTVEIQDIQIDDIAQRQGHDKNAQKQGNYDIGRKSDRSFRYQLIWMLIFFCLAFARAFYIFWLQVTGTYFERNFPDCVDSSGQSYFHLALQHAQDGNCYGGPLNTIQCGFEDGDCIYFNMVHPLCRGDDLVDSQNEVGNGTCNRSFAIPGCSYDGGDCCPYSVQQSLSFGDGICNGGLAATELCGYDNGDCRSFVTTYPECPLEEIVTSINGTAPIILGDGICDSQIYNITECGHENGDCI